jgi:plastocyanin
MVSSLLLWSYSRFTLEEDIMRSSVLVGGVLAFASALAMWSCGGASSSGVTPSPSTPTPASTNIVVNIASSAGATAFNPNPVQAAVGQKVAFKNSDAVTHHIVMDDGSMDFGAQASGAMSQTLTIASGTDSKFHCLIHSSMVGAINGPVPDPPPCMSGYCN